VDKTPQAVAELSEAPCVISALVMNLLYVREASPHRSDAAHQKSWSALTHVSFIRAYCCDRGPLACNWTLQANTTVKLFSRVHRDANEG
jgi:hypothetical protein